MSDAEKVVTIILAIILGGMLLAAIIDWRTGNGTP